MNILQKAWRGITGQKAVRMIGSPAGDSSFITGNMNWYGTENRVYVNHGYVENDIVYSAVNLVMDKVKCAPWDLYKVEDESSLKLYTGLMSKKNFTPHDWAEAVKLRRKALVPLTNLNLQTGKLKDLITWPNEEEAFNDLVANSVGYEMITGNSMWDGDPLAGGANQGIPNEFHNLPAHLITIVVTRSYPQRIVGYILNLGENIKFSKERILHIKHWNPCFDNMGSQLSGLSPLAAARKVLKRSNSAKHASVMAFENGNAIGVLYVDDIRLNADDAQAQIQAVKAKWNMEYTGPDAFNKVAHSGYKMGFTKITDTLVDMNLIKVEDLDLRRLSNIWGIPSQMLNDPENKTYNNSKEGESALTARCVLPKLSTRRDNLNRKLQNDWGFKGKNVYADFNMNVFTELQEESKQKWEWVSKLPVSTAYKLEMMGLDVPDDKAMQEILIPKGYQLLQDVIDGDMNTEMDEDDENDRRIEEGGRD